jgi:hypothetical protein
MINLHLPSEIEKNILTFFFPLPRGGPKHEGMKRIKEIIHAKLEAVLMPFLVTRV